MGNYPRIAENASCSIRRAAKGKVGLRSRFPVKITVTWRELATTVAKSGMGTRCKFGSHSCFIPVAETKSFD